MTEWTESSTFPNQLVGDVALDAPPRSSARQFPTDKVLSTRRNDTDWSFGRNQLAAIWCCIGMDNRYDLVY